MDSRTPVPIQVRRMHFELDSAPRYWHSDSPFLTHWFTAMSLFFPAGERFFIDSVLHFEPQITDPRLREEVRAFAAQESQHSRHHRAYDQLMSRDGVPVTRYEGWIEKGLRVARRLLPPKAQLALTITLEHFTAVFANQLLSDPRVSEGMHPAVRPLWMWHAVEETEHKAVAYDVYEHVGGGYWLRALMMVRVLAFPLAIAFFQLLLMAGDRNFGSRRNFARGVRLVWGRGGFLRSAWPDLRDFFRRDFHPWQTDNRELIVRWTAEHEAAAAAQ